MGIHPGLWFLPEAFGGDTINHGNQQVGKMIVVSPHFPGVEGLGKSFSFMEEWFLLVRFAKDLHVILVQDCADMKKADPLDRRCYDRPPYPATWGRMYGKGRVYYTSMGHRGGCLDEQNLSADPVGWAAMGLGRRCRRHRTQHRSGYARGKCKGRSEVSRCSKIT